MPAPANSDEFLDLVGRSGVADDARLKGYLGRLGAEFGVPSDPVKLAGLLVRDGLLTHFQAEQLLQGKWKRFSIGKYKVLERIGAGGMGQVFLCEHKLMRRRVAVKVLPAAKARDPSSLDRFYREARAVAAVDHPNIVRAYDIDQDDNLHFLVMEFVDGTNLQDLVKKVGPLGVARACHYIYGAAVGLQHAHEMGLVHRDIKPGNILVDRAGVVKILDLGLARFFNPDEDDLLTKKYDENILGTADYLSPEQAIDSHKVDIRADIYSLGGTFYFLLTGQPPFPEGSVAQKLLWHQTREPAPVRSLRPDVPADVAEVVARMMAKDPAARYQTPADAMAALGQWVLTPIAPPAEREMPQLSLAAQGPGGTPVASRTLTAPPSFIAPATPSPSQATATGYPTPGSAVRIVAAPVPVQAPTPAAAPPAPIVADPPAADGPPPEVWESLADETRADAKADTGTPKSARKVAVPATPRRRRVLLFVVAGGLLGLCGLGAVAAGVVVLMADRKPPAPTTTAQPKTWYVSKAGGSPDPDRTVGTLKAAWEKAAADDVIVLLDDRMDEPAVLLNDPRSTHKGIRIEAGNAAKLVTWAPPAGGARRQGVIEVATVDGLKVSGLVLEPGGPTGLPAGVAVNGTCPGLEIENVTVRSPKEAGFLLSVSGAADRPARVSRCRVVATEPIEAGVRFSGANKFVKVENCRFEGPGQAAVKFGTADARADTALTDVEVRNNRAFNWDRGVWLTGKLPADGPFGLTVANNTFHTMTAAGIEAEAPKDGLKWRATLSRNYFAGCKQVAAVTGSWPGLKATENAKDAATPEGNPPTDSLVEDGAVPPPNPANDAEFLRPAAGRLTAVGPGRVPVGAQP